MQQHSTDVWHADLQVKNPGTGLVANVQQIAEPFGRDEHRALAVSPQQRVSCYSRSHSNALDPGRVHGLIPWVLNACHYFQHATDTLSKYINSIQIQMTIV